MAVFERQKTKQRRVDPRKLRGEGIRGELLRAVQPRNLLRLAVLVMILAGALLVMHAPIESTEYTVGAVVTQDIHAQVDFSYINSQATRQAREQAASETPHVYERDTTNASRLRDEFVTLVTAAREAARREAAAAAETPPAAESPGAGNSAPRPQSEQLPANGDQPAVPPGDAADGRAVSPAEASEAEPGRRPEATDDPAEDDADSPAPTTTPPDGGAESTGIAPVTPPVAETEADEAPTPPDLPAPPPAPMVSQERLSQLLRDWQIDAQLWKELKRVSSNADLREAAVHKFNQFMSRAELVPILSENDLLREMARSSIVIWSESAIERRDRGLLLNAENADNVRSALSPDFRQEFAGSIFGSEMRTGLLAHVADNIGPTLRFSRERTREAQEARAAQTPPVVVSVSHGERLVEAGTELTPAHQEILQAHRQAMNEQVPWWRHVLSFLASALLISSLLFVLSGYTVISEPRIAGRAARAFVLGALFLLVLVVARILRTNPPMELFPLTTAALVVTIAYGRQFAIACTWVLVLLVVLVTRLSFDETLIMIVGTSVAIMQLGEIRSRGKLIRVGFVTGIVYFLLVWAVALWSGEFEGREVLLQSVWWRSVWAFLSGLLSGFIVLGVLPFIERIFNIVTSISLLELCDVNQPALRKLAIEAPGSYSHSLLLGTLVEPAAESIGANGLLARVGAYFHDIGKANKPHYFVENRDQLIDAPDHDRLTPQMSKIVITGHIKDGLDMARYYGLPKVVQSFIAEHHGTTVIEYFYHEARKGGGADIPDSEFRYAGPKPQSKETAILMMADGCEGAVRSIKEPTPSKIEDRVHDIIMKRLLDGQLNESGLTLNEVWTIEQSLKKSLISVYHGRIAYPSSEVRKEPAAGREQPPGESQNGGAAAVRPESGGR